jgi:DNA-binding CsgD family transcriptional regulator
MKTLMRPAAGARLTQREKQVLGCAALGLTSRESGVLIGIREETVKTYRQHILSKLGARNITHAVALAFKAGIMAAEPAPS